MVIENAERFGLSQLHQLRGRVGRGQEESFCILFNESKGDVAKERMKVMEKTNDGFVISEKDLELRGPGEFFGTRQHGLPELKIANLYKDVDILKTAQEAAANLIKDDPMLSGDENKGIKMAIKEKFAGKIEGLSFL
jgi:ATP-dependent DNA helicase RecG